MAIDTTSPRSRRALLAAAAGGAIGAVVTKLGSPDPAAAASTAMMTETTNTTSASTRVEGAGGTNFEVFRVNSPGQAPAIQAESATGAGVVGSSGGAGIGVIGVSSSGWGVAAISPTGTGLYAATEYGLPPVQAGVAILAHVTDKTRTGIRAEGRVVFPDRCGKATVLKTRTYTDITVAGGLTSRSVIHATLQTYRAGVAIAAVRRNYPTKGKARIYLTKVASTTSSTYVGWFVAEY